MVKFVVGSGIDRKVVPMATAGKDVHDQRRAVKSFLGLIK